MRAHQACTSSCLVLAHRRLPQTLDASVLEARDTSLMRLCSKHVMQRRSCRGLCFCRAHNLIESEIKQPWLCMNCNAHLARHRCDVPNPLVSDGLLISNSSRIYYRCGYMNPSPQEAYLNIFPARFHQPRMKSYQDLIRFQPRHSGSYTSWVRRNPGFDCRRSNLQITSFNGMQYRRQLSGT